MQIPTWLDRLLHTGSIPSSAIPNADRGLVDHFRHLGFVTIATSGTRRRVIMTNRDAVQEWVERAYAAPPVPEAVGPRAANIRRARDSKRGRARHAVQPLLLRCFSADPHWRWAALTQQCGMVGFTSDRVAELAPPAPWRLLTVENWEPFLAVDYRPRAGAVVALYTGGSVAAPVVRAIAAITPPPVTSVHFGDCDWAGLAIYRRIRALLPPITFHVPDGIDDLFRTSATYHLARTQRPLIMRPDDPPEVRTIADLIAQWNAGLEQEIIPPPTWE